VNIQSVEVPMHIARAVALVMFVTALAGCSTGGEKSRPVAQEVESTPTTADLGGPSGPLTTLPWDEVDLEGRVLGIEDRRSEECATDTCVLGMVTITDAVASAGDRAPIADTRLVVTDETRLIGCGPGDEGALITFDQFLAMPSEVIGEIPAAVWIARGVDGQQTDAAEAEQVISGSCG